MKLDVPNDHQVGMEVPQGGSSCASCKYVSGDLKNCSNKFFQKFNGGPELPAPAESYCCDFYEQKVRDKPRSAKDLRPVK
jgi:hypothetical protein